ncbi:hypothetical protein NHX12_034288 [Muraenolepis orangiensis]|uniref:Serine/threonine-protein kinase WNK CCTL2 domain-containing protein n=1 Tax=Muraenolepis orangiensis TaxID=630683 RepID=A0A9Q0D2Y6_9TELE|nr:hypothetical protein NHX12_034288 [Muraenolepis orangiensis]
MKRHQRRSVRSRSRHEKTGKAKLNVLNISNLGDRVAECQLETHNRKMVTFKFDLDGDNPEEIAKIMVQSEFILESERESFIEQVREVIETADERGQTSGDAEQQMSATSVPMPDLPASAISQVVHSSGRKFIVSPAFSELGQNRYDPGPSTAPASIPCAQPHAPSAPHPQAPVAAPQSAQTATRGQPQLRPQAQIQPQASAQAQNAVAQAPPDCSTACPVPLSSPATGFATQTSPPSAPPSATLPPVFSPPPPTPSSSSFAPLLGGTACDGPSRTPLPCSSPPATLSTSAVTAVAAAGPQLVTSTASSQSPRSSSPASRSPSSSSLTPGLPLGLRTVTSDGCSAAPPGQSHALCEESCDGRCEASVESQGKVDDIHALDKKLRSLFMDLGGPAPAAQGELPPCDPTTGAPVAGTTTPVGPSPATSSSGPSANPPMPPSTLALGAGGTVTPVQGPGTPTSAPAQTNMPAASYGPTTPSKTPLSRVSSQQPLEDLDAQLRRALSPETEEQEAPSLPPSVFKLGRFQVSIAADEPPKASSTPLRRAVALGGDERRADVVDGLPSPIGHRTPRRSLHPSPFSSPCASPMPCTTIGRFQVTTSPQSGVGPLPVRSAQEQGDCPSAAQATNGPSGRSLTAPTEPSSPDPMHRASLPSVNSSSYNNSYNNSYVSSDNDSEFEDEEFKQQLNRLREKHMLEIQVPPPAVLPPVALAGRRRRPTKSKSSKSSRNSSTQGSRSPLQPGSTLSAQSVPPVSPGRLALLTPAGLSDPGGGSLLRPMKSSPSDDNLYSAYTSDGALSVPGLCAPTPGCVKFSWGSERLAFKPGGRRTRFLSTPCLALCV